MGLKKILSMGSRHRIVIMKTRLFSFVPDFAQEETTCSCLLITVHGVQTSSAFIVELSSHIETIERSEHCQRNELNILFFLSFRAFVRARACVCVCVYLSLPASPRPPIKPP